MVYWFQPVADIFLFPVKGKFYNFKGNASPGRLSMTAVNFFVVCDHQTIDEWEAF
jgi:hypothetical protein